MAIAFVQSFAEQLPWQVLVSRYDHDTYGGLIINGYHSDGGPSNLPWVEIRTGVNAYDASIWRIDPTETIALAGWFMWTGSLAPVGTSSTGIFYLGNRNEWLRVWFTSFSWRVQSTTSTSTTYLVEVPFPNYEPNRWFYAEMKLTRNGTTTDVVIRVDGTEHFNGNVAYEFTEMFDSAGLLIRQGTTSSTSRTTGFSCFTIDDAGLLYGPLITPILTPTTQGFHDEWEPSTPAYISAIPESTDEIRGIMGARTTYNTTPLASVQGLKEVLAVAQSARCIGGEGQIYGLTRIGGVDYTTTTGEWPSNFWQFDEKSLVQNFWYNNPATALPWTISDINGAEFGFEAATPNI